jgi:predicted SAM-dependent methyltransferase|tara:strand:- start:3228 stop:3722 length:495 start_codon:yes stop_codon:yes gene_type:complete
MKTIEYKNKQYPFFQTQGNASQFAIPFAKHFCEGVGYDIGCNQLEWAFPGAIPVDIDLDNNNYEAMTLGEEQVDYIYSSHCLEHLNKWVDVLDYWTTCLKLGGTLFLYLPHYNQEYWRSWNNRKHLNNLRSDVIVDYLTDNGYTNIFASERDLNDSFMIVGEKQ